MGKTEDGAAFIQALAAADADSEVLRRHCIRTAPWPLFADTARALLALESRLAEAEKQNGLLWSKGDYWEGVAKDAQEDRDRAEKALADMESERDFILNDADHKEAGFALAAETDRARLARIETAAAEAARWLDAAGMDHAARTLRTALALPGAEGREGEKDA